MTGHAVLQFSQDTPSINKFFENVIEHQRRKRSLLTKKKKKQTKENSSSQFPEMSNTVVVQKGSRHECECYYTIVAQFLNHFDAFTVFKKKKGNL